MGQLVGYFCVVELADIQFDQALLRGEETVMMNVGLETARAVYRERVLASKIIPSGPNA